MGRRIEDIELQPKIPVVEQQADMDNASDNDFILCLQTEFQRDMLRKFGSLLG